MEYIYSSTGILSTETIYGDPFLGMDGLIVLFFALAALSVGSFLNVLIYRLPLILQSKWKNEANLILGFKPTPQKKEINLFLPPSHCPTCQQHLRYRDNIPIISWVALSGKCKGCGSPIPLRYPAVELLSLLSFFVAIVVWGYTYTTILYLIFLWSLIALAFIDYETGLLPDEITQPILWIGLIAPQLYDTEPNFPSLYDALAGALIGYISMWSIYWVFKIITTKEGMGHGDFKLFAVIGAWLGWRALPEVGLIAASLGLLFVFSFQLLARFKLTTIQINPAIPFGPFLSAAGCVTLLLQANTG